MVVFDKFHVVRMANDAIERIRKRIRRELEPKTRIKMKNERFVLLKRRHELTDDEKEKLQAWSRLHPALALAHEAKESLYAIYDQPNRKAAEAEARAWLARLSPLIATEFRETAGALNSWWQEIFDIYDHPVTNAYTESDNRLARYVNRTGRGYSFDVIRARCRENHRLAPQLPTPACSIRALGAHPRSLYQNRLRPHLLAKVEKRRGLNLLELLRQVGGWRDRSPGFASAC